MKALSDPLWQKLAAFPFDTPGARLPFTARLARDNAWPLAYAYRVLEEYRRFLYLAVRARHPVTPSDAVDQAWHLHLVYTESYWNDLCADTLGRPLHHGPTKGGAAEDAKYEDWYERTRQSYREHFGENPPLDVWPPSSVRFGPASRGQRVSTHDAWIIPKPAFLRRRAAAPALFAVGLAPLLLAFTFEPENILVLIIGFGGIVFFPVVFIWALISSYRKRNGGKDDGGSTGCGGSGCGSGGSKDSGCSSHGDGGSGCSGGSGCGGGGCGGGGD